MCASCDVFPTIVAPGPPPDVPIARLALDDCRYVAAARTFVSVLLLLLLSTLLFVPVRAVHRDRVHDRQQRHLKLATGIVGTSETLFTRIKQVRSTFLLFAAVLFRPGFMRTTLLLWTRASCRTPIPVPPAYSLSCACWQISYV